MSGFPPARPSRDKRTGGRRRNPKPVRTHPFVASGHYDHRGVGICDVCGSLWTDRQHVLPETPDEAREIDERRAP